MERRFQTQRVEHIIDRLCSILLETYRHTCFTSLMV